MLKAKEKALYLQLYELNLQKYTLQNNPHPELAASFAMENILSIYKNPIKNGEAEYIFGMEIEDALQALSDLTN